MFVSVKTTVEGDSKSIRKDLSSLFRSLLTQTRPDTSRLEYSCHLIKMLQETVTAARVSSSKLKVCSCHHLLLGSSSDIA